MQQDASYLGAASNRLGFDMAQNLATAKSAAAQAGELSSFHQTGKAVQHVPDVEKLVSEESADDQEDASMQDDGDNGTCGTAHKLRKARCACPRFCQEDVEGEDEYCYYCFDAWMEDPPARCDCTAPGRCCLFPGAFSFQHMACHVVPREVKGLSHQNMFIYEF